MKKALLGGLHGQQRGLAGKCLKRPCICCIFDVYPGPLYLLIRDLPTLDGLFWCSKQFYFGPFDFNFNVGAFDSAPFYLEPIDFGPFI